MRKRLLLIAPLLLGLSLSLISGGCGKGANETSNSNTSRADSSAPSKYPGTEAGARSLLGEFLKPGANHATLSKQLRPAKEDYAAVFVGDLAAKAESTYSPMWDQGQAVIAPKAGQTELLLSSATSEEIKNWTGKAATDFPGGYQKVGASLKPGLTLYRFKFVEPGKDLGMAFDGLVYVNNQWRIFPKPWRLLE
jgi:hypothetical protein